MLPRRRLLAAAVASAMSGCSIAGDGGTATGPPRDPPGGADAPGGASRPATGGTDRTTSGRAGRPAAAYTHLRPSGNRFVAGRGSIHDADPVDADAGVEPAWLLAAPAPGGSRWIAVGPDGRTSGFDLRGTGVEPVDVRPGRLPAGMPPVLSGFGDGTARLLRPPDGASTLTHPIRFGDRRAFVARNGDLVVRDGGEERRLAVDALPDARIVRAGNRIAVLGGATDRYDHGALGDPIEAGAVVVADVSGEPAVEERIRIPGGAVVEGIAPVLADLTGDGRADAIVTESDAGEGARVVAYGLDGERIAAGPPVGSGFRWRHGLAVAPFGPGGGRELAVVRTPHIGGTVEFYRHGSGSLRIVATAAGYSSHDLGSRNLDGAVAADADGDGRVELLVPTDDRGTLAAVARTPDGAAEAWRRSIGGTVRSNLAATATADGGLAVGVGRGDGVVRVWR